MRSRHWISDQRRRGIFALLVFGQLWWSSLSLAADKMSDSQRILYEQGRTLFGERRYAEAADAFLAAYRINQLPRLLQNIAAAHSRIARDEQSTRANRLSAAVSAVNYLDQYLAHPSNSRDEKETAQVQQHRAEMKRLFDKLSTQEMPPPPAAPQPTATQSSELPSYRKGWFVGIMIALGLVVAGGATTAGILLTRPAQPSKESTVIDLSSSSLEIRF